MQEIRLYGHLAQKFGRSFFMDVKNTAEAVRALCSNFQSFRSELEGPPDARRYYKVFIGASKIHTSDALVFPTSKKEIIRIVPVVVGAKDEFFGVVVGVALIAASFYLPVTPLISGLSVSLSTIAFNLGATLLLGGLAAALSPTPNAEKPSDREAPQNKPSYLFDGPVNVTLQGHAVPVGYGRLIVGSAVISSGLEAEDYPI